MWFVIEGCDGAGKDTAIKILEKIFKEKGVEPRLTREPGGTPSAEKLREFIIHREIQNEPMPDEVSILLLNAARYYNYHNVIKPTIDRGGVVISSRFNWSTYAYAKESNHAKCIILHDLFFHGIKPDYVIYLTADNEILLKRIHLRNSMDEIERELTSERLNEIKKGYDYFLSNDSDQKVLIIDTGKNDITEVENQISAYLNMQGVFDEIERTTKNQT